MDFQEFENKTGFRMPFHYLPHNSNTALKMHIPLGFFYSPFVAEAASYQTSAPKCTKCGSVVHLNSRKNKTSRKWTCYFCGTDNPLLMDVGNYFAEEFVEQKVGETGIFFIVDLSMPREEFEGLKKTLLSTIRKLPKNIFVGIVAFSRCVYLYDFAQKTLKFECFNGRKDYPVQNLRERLNFIAKNDPRHASIQATSRYFVPIEKYQDKLIQCVESLDPDSFEFNKDHSRQERATGCAINIALTVIEASNVYARIPLLISGPCTTGPGQVVDLPLKQTMRNFLDIKNNSTSIRYMEAAKKYYSVQQSRLIHKHTLDIWAFGLDQYGLLEMKDMAVKSGGNIVMHELFNHFIFEKSFSAQYQANENGLFNFPIAAKITLFISKQMKIKGLVGFGKSLKEDKLKMKSDMEFGEGNTNTWYIGGLLPSNSLTFFIANSDDSKDSSKQKQCVIQAVTQFKYSDNVLRTRVSTISRPYFPDSKIKEIISVFDQQAAVVLLARMASYKADAQENQQVRTWLDRTLQKFLIKFAKFKRYELNSFNLPASLKLFPQFLYHLRRSNLVNTFNCSPDESVYIRSCLMRQGIDNCIVMIQPALLMYTVDNPQAQAVLLDIENMKQDVILVLDSYFHVIVWYGSHILNWKRSKIYQQDEYSYLSDLFNTPLTDASSIMYERLPVPNFYETFKGDGKERYLKSRVNPSTTSSDMVETGDLVTDDAPIKMFMDYLIKSVVNSTQ